ncbi:hypothetical protein DTO013E5_8941 [Penicillium roqueforti]|nr:hypothetical protein DTO012A1_8819 [Penicillium roqueforti]KAI2744818.1 hypothetical protein DTO013F2_7684 [Penicillium roqueforti]KAI3200713.1 hypothetical protein DTO013E5_8941 [Penicillium roqueforti]
MGIVESRLLANSLLSACNKAAEEGKHQLDESEFWRDIENVKASKSIYKHIPQRIRPTSRQSAIKKAIVRSSQQLQAPQIVQDLQDKRESLFPLYLPTSSEKSSDGSSSTRQIAPFSCHVPTSLQPCPLADFYKLVVLCENQQQLGKIRLRICYVAFFRLKNAVQPGTQYQYDDASMFIAHLIRDSGCEDSLSDIERRVRHWVGLGERYSLLANDLGGLGVLYLLPQDGGESIWTKELPKSPKRPRRIAMLNHLRQKGLPEEAQTRGLHALAEDEAAKVLGPIKASLERVMESQLSEANAHIVDENRQSYRTWPQSDIPQIRQPSAGTPSSQSGAPVATQVASTVGSPCNAMFSGQENSEMVQDVSDLHYEPSLTQISLQNRPDIMTSQVHTHGLEPVYMPTKSGSCETLIPHFGNTAVENSAQFNMERNVQVTFLKLSQQHPPRYLQITLNYFHINNEPSLPRITL